MLTITKELTEKFAVLKLSGDIDETVDLNKLLGVPELGARLDCANVRRINSVGIKNWIAYFRQPAVQDAKITLIRCSSPLIEQSNMLSNFLTGLKIESLIANFTCSKCEMNLPTEHTIEAISANNFELPPIKCPKCGGKAVFDDDPEEFFYFIKR